MTQVSAHTYTYHTRAFKATLFSRASSTAVSLPNSFRLPTLLHFFLLPSKIISSLSFSLCNFCQSEITRARKRRNRCGNAIRHKQDRRVGPRRRLSSDPNPYRRSATSNRPLSKRSNPRRRSSASWSETATATSWNRRTASSS